MKSLVPKFVPKMSRAALAFAVTLKTSQGKALLQSDRMATLFIDVLRSYAARKQFKVHDFVVLRNQVLLLLAPSEGSDLEKTVDRMRWRFAFRAREELNIRGWIWEKDFARIPIFTQKDLLKHKSLIHQGPVAAGLAKSAEEYPYCLAWLSKNKKAAAKAGGTD